jgi:hypothetical protein
MANVLTDLAADIYKAADIVGREQVGAVSSVLINANASERVAVGDTVRSHFTRPVAVKTDATPSMTIPEGTDQTVDNKTATITNTANVQIPWTGEDIRSVNNGSGYESIYGDQIAQAMRAITNSIESAVMLGLKNGASRAFGTAGTTQFASNFNDVAELRQILVEQGTPIDGQVSMVLSQSAGTKLRNLAQLQKANESNSDSLLRNGVLLDLQGVGIKETAQAPAHTKGTATGALVNGALAVGATSIVFDGATAGATGIVAGDVITFAADTVNKYVVTVGASGATGTITIGAPLRTAIPDNNAITVGNNYTGSVVLHRNAAELIMRAPAMPNGGDAAVDVMTVQDPFSGLVYEIAAYKGYQKAMFDVRCVYGFKVWKNEFVAASLG